MKTRLFFPLFGAAFMLVFGQTLILTAQSRAAGDISEDISSGEAAPYQPALRPTSSTAAIKLASSGAAVLITDIGLEPSRVSIQAGQVVTWTNQTGSAQRLVSGYPVRVFLPVLLCSVTTTALAQHTPESLASWGGDIAPNGIYTHTFAAEGHYPYFIAAQPAWAGQVIVQPTPRPGRDLNEIARAILFLVAGYNPSPLPGDCESSITDPHWLYYESEAWLDHGISGSYTEIRNFYPNLEFVQRYSLLVEASDAEVSPHSFRHDVPGLPAFGLFKSYTGTYTSTLYDPFTYSVALTYTNILRGELGSATVIKDYGNGETYRVELDNIGQSLIYPVVESYVATVYGADYSGTTQAVNDVRSDPIIRPVFCKQ